MTTINVYVSCLTDPLVYITLACRRSDLKASPTKLTGLGDMKIRSRNNQVASGLSTDQEAATKAAAKSQVTYDWENEETEKEKTSAGKEDGREECVEEKVSCQEEGPEGVSFACTEL